MVVTFNGSRMPGLSTTRPWNGVLTFQYSGTRFKWQLEGLYECQIIMTFYSVSCVSWVGA